MQHRIEDDRADCGEVLRDAVESLTKDEDNIIFDETIKALTRSIRHILSEWVTHIPGPSSMAPEESFDWDNKEHWDQVIEYDSEIKAIKDLVEELEECSIKD